ncbi:Uncharacterized conserved protein YdhG, YjbR/CyaY-like superfamily, DUF1801 family [Arthrobacter sp. 49Tsu3.1M3]|jgi:uncharacterized protein YdhG (YjbR/CyaY superfamily)|uniref:iron chaperone n=1 Tax=Arthrobacter sp. 49Tsu3.1M3 TaxID=1279029 RepID=UPI0009A81B1C|nr:DUF1801 domain-containing protein [Arthrobacter sp. 49Tsu3.1M3]SKB63536.1 Uncharacterized conserved protein YdhG, YjbR/CyaY-like superfamily, DUF1801 family [Arthrobacter sp. 49Tsu3.1M3]
MAQHFESVEEYIASFPADVQEAMQEIRRHCHAAVPGSGETISYGIPTITLGGKCVVYFAAWAHHISVYPMPDGDESLATELAPYCAAKGTLKFPLRKPVPYELIGKVAGALAQERRSGTP